MLLQKIICNDTLNLLSKVIPNIVTDSEIGRERKKGWDIVKGEEDLDKIIVLVLDIFNDNELVENHVINSVMQL